MRPTLPRCATAVLTLAASSFVLRPAPAEADAFLDRANEIVADYGVGGSYYTSSPGSGTAASEWKKGVFAAAMAAFIQGDVTTGRSRANAGLDLRLSSDMFFLGALVDLWQRKPLEFADPADGPLNGRIDLTKVKEGLWAQCWQNDPGSTDNHHLLYNTARLFGAEYAVTNNRVGQTTGSSSTPCTGTYWETLDGAGARAWIEKFIDDTMLYGFPEEDSATYLGVYLAPLRLIADHYGQYGTEQKALANKAAKAFEWMVTNMAGEWTNGSFTATTGREYFPADGSVYRPAELGNYLRVLFGGRVRTGTRTWEDAGGGIRKAWAATAVPLALTLYRPCPEVLVSATDRSAPFVQRESTRMSTGQAPSRAQRTRYVEPGWLELATSADGASGWGSKQGQNLTLHTDSATNENRTLTLANPENSSPWTVNVFDGFKPLGARPELQWVQDGRSALGVLELAAVAPALIRGSTGDDLLQASWGAGTYSNNPWHVFGSDNKLWIGVRSVANLVDEGNGDPLNAIDDSWFFSAKNPGNGRGSYVIVDAVRQTDMSRSAFAASLNRSVNPRVVCTGIVAAGCTMPTPSSRPSVSYTNMAERTITVSFPDAGGPAQRWVAGVQLEDETHWPLLETPWAQQSVGGDVLRVSAITGATSTTKVTEYRTYSTVLATQTFSTVVGTKSGTFELWDGTAPNLQPSGWVNSLWAGAPSFVRSSSAHTGTYAGQVALTSAGEAGFALNQNYRPDITNDRVTVTAWLKASSVSSGPGEGAYVSAQYTQADGTRVCGEVKSTPITGTSTTWLSRSVTLPAKTCAAGITKVAISVHLKGTGTLLVDDIDYALHP